MLHETGFTPDECEFRSTMEKVAERINEELKRDDGPESFPRNAWIQVCDSGMPLLPVPREDGGLGVGIRGTMYVIEGFSRHCDDAGFVFSVCTHMCSLLVPLARFGSKELKREILPQALEGKLVGAHAISEPHAGSSAFEMHTRARLEEDGWHLDGEKCFVSNAPFADVVLVYAKTGDRGGLLSDYSCFAVPLDAPGVTVGRPDDKFGLRTSRFASIYFDDVILPHSSVLGRPGMGFTILDYVMKREILITFASRLGVMSRLFESTREHARTRTQFGRRISAFQAVSHRLVDDLIALESARMWLYRAACLLDEGRQATREIAIAKLVCSEADLKLATDAVRLHGAAGYVMQSGLPDAVADALGGVIYSGTNEIQRNRIAATLGL